MISVRLDTGQTVTFDDGTDEDTIKSVMAHVEAGTYGHLLAADPTHAPDADPFAGVQAGGSSTSRRPGPIYDLSHLNANGPVPVPAANSAGIQLKLATPAPDFSNVVGGVSTATSTDPATAKRAELARIAASGDINRGDDGSASALDVAKEFVSGLPERVVGTVSGAVTQPLRAAESVVKGLGTEIAQDVLNPSGVTSTGEGFRRGASRQWQESDIGQAGDAVQRLVDPARQRLLDVSIKAGMPPEAAAFTDTGQAAAAEAFNPVNYIAPEMLVGRFGVEALDALDALAPAAVRAAELEAQGGARAIEGDAGLVTREFGHGSAPSEIAQQKLARDLAIPKEPLIQFDQYPNPTKNITGAPPTGAWGLKGKIPDTVRDILGQPRRVYGSGYTGLGEGDFAPGVPLENPTGPPPRPRWVERDPLPLPPIDPGLVGADDQTIGQIGGLWNYASRRYPLLAKQVQRIHIGEPMAGGYFEPDSGTIGLPWNANLGTIMHEFGHIAQHVRGQLEDFDPSALSDADLAHIEAVPTRLGDIYGRVPSPQPVPVGRTNLVPGIYPFGHNDADMLVGGIDREGWGVVVAKDAKGNAISGGPGQHDYVYELHRPGQPVRIFRGTMGDVPAETRAMDTLRDEYLQAHPHLQQLEFRGQQYFGQPGDLPPSEILQQTYPQTAGEIAEGERIREIGQRIREVLRPQGLNKGEMELDGTDPPRLLSGQRPGAASVPYKLGGVLPAGNSDLNDLANTSLNIGSSPPAGARVPVQVVDGGGEGAVRRLSAVDDTGNQIGSMTYTAEPGGGFRVIDVETGARGSGAGREMFAAAAAKEGPYRGTMAMTPEGEGFVNRLRETNPEIFGADEASSGAVQRPDQVGQFTRRLYAGGSPPPTPLSEADTAAAMGWAHPLNQPGSPNAIIDPIRLPEFQTNLAAQLGPKDGPRVAQWITQNSDEVFRKIGPPQSWNTVEDMASRSGTTAEEFLRDNPRWNTLAPEERMRLSYVIKGNEQEIGNLQSKLAAGTATEEDKADLLRRIDNAGDLIKIGAKSGSDYGRALNTLKIEARLGLGDDQLLRQQIYRKYAQQLDREKPLMDTLARLNPKDPDELQALLRQVNKPELRDFMQEIFVNSILSSPVPFERKVIGDTIMMLGENGLVRPIAAVFDAARGGIAGTAQSVANAGTAAARDSFLVETPAAFVGLGRGIQKGFQRGIEVLQRGYDPRLAEGNALFVPRSAFARAESPFVRNVVGPFVTMPTRVISAATTMARTMNFTAELYAQAARVAAKEELLALKAGTEVPDTAGRIAGLIANPTDEMLTAADKFAGRTTFTDETSAVGKAITNVRDLPNATGSNVVSRGALETYRAIGGFLLPFIHIADRLMVRGLEYTPLGFGGAVGERLAGNYAESASAAARATIGSAVMAYAASLAYQGRLTGAAPTNPAERAASYAAGKQPFSAISDSGVVVPYGHMQPIAMPFALVASMYDGWRQNPNDDLMGKITAGAMEVGTHISDQSYLLTLSKLMEVLHGSEQGRAGRAGSDLLAGTLSGMAPYSALTRTIAKTIDPRVIDDRSFSGKILQNVPVASLGLTGKLDPWGEEVVPQGGRARTFLASGTALLSSQLTPQPLDDELARLGMPLGYVGSTISDHKKQVKLSDDEHFQYQQLAGRASKLTIGAVIARDGYADLDTEVQRSQITQAIGAARKYARIVTLRAHNNASNYPGLNPDLGSINMVNESARE